MVSVGADVSRLARLESHVEGIFDKLDMMSNVLLQMNSGNKGKAPAPDHRPSPPSPRTVESVPSYEPPRASTASTSPARRLPGLSASASYDSTSQPPYPYRPFSQSSQRSEGSKAAQKTPSYGTGWSRPADSGPRSASSAGASTVHNPYIDAPGPSPQSSTRSVGAHNPADLHPIVRSPPSPTALSDGDALEHAVRSLSPHQDDPILLARGDHSILHAREHHERGDNGQPGKKRRLGGAGDWKDAGPRGEKGDPLRRAADPVTLGLISEEEGKRLFEA